MFVHKTTITKFYKILYKVYQTVNNKQQSSTTQKFVFCVHQSVVKKYEKYIKKIATNPSLKVVKPRCQIKQRTTPTNTKQKTYTNTFAYCQHFTVRTINFG